MTPMPDPLWQIIIGATAVGAVISGGFQYLHWCLNSGQERKTWSRTKRAEVAASFLSACNALWHASCKYGQYVDAHPRDRAFPLTNDQMQEFLSVRAEREEYRIRADHEIGLMRLYFPDLRVKAKEFLDRSADGAKDWPARVGDLADLDAARRDIEDYVIRTLQLAG